MKGVEHATHLTTPGAALGAARSQRSTQRDPSPGGGYWDRTCGSDLASTPAAARRLMMRAGRRAGGTRLALLPCSLSCPFCFLPQTTMGKKKKVAALRREGRQRVGEARLPAVAAAVAMTPEELEAFLAGEAPPPPAHSSGEEPEWVAMIQRYLSESKEESRN